MNYNKVKRLQKEMGYATMQQLVDNGQAWMMEGGVGREAMYLLEIGAVMLPKRPHQDYYGNTIPSRDWLKEGKGTFKNSVNFYNNVYNN
jgi:hypothetical protein